MFKSDEKQLSLNQYIVAQDYDPDDYSIHIDAANHGTESMHFYSEAVNPEDDVQFPVFKVNSNEK